MPGALNPLLKRQLKRLDLAADGEPPSAEVWPQLLDSVSRAYTEAEQDRYLLERSQEVSSNEMNELNRELRIAGAPEEPGLAIVGLGMGTKCRSAVHLFFRSSFGGRRIRSVRLVKHPLHGRRRL